jgi:hypothetical protein
MWKKRCLMQISLKLNTHKYSGLPRWHGSGGLSGILYARRSAILPAPITITGHTAAANSIHA